MVSPPHGGDDLLGQQLLGVAVIDRPGLVGVQGKLRLAHLAVRQHLGKALGRRGHEGGVEAPCHLQGQGPAAGGLHRGGEGGQLLLGAGHGDLAGAVVVDGVGLRELGAEGLYRGVLQLQHRSHGGGLGLGGLLHQLPRRQTR